jgi:signal transduction histidine kinase
MSKTPSSTKKTGSNKKASKVSILSKYSHELKTPLHGVLGISKFLYEHWNDVSDAKKLICMNSIIDATTKMSQILNLMLSNISNRDNLNFKLKKIELVKNFEKTTEQFKNLHYNKKNVTIKYTSQIKECFISGDIFWLNQVLINLLSNAFNNTDKGKIEVLVDIAEVKNQQYCYITVKDSGVGIAEEYIDRIFQPFIKAPKVTQYNSTGLGLNICSEVINAHHGQITARNNKDKGSSVEFCLPVLT